MIRRNSVKKGNILIFKKYLENETRKVLCEEQQQCWTVDCTEKDSQAHSYNQSPSDHFLSYPHPSDYLISFFFGIAPFQPIPLLEIHLNKKKLLC